MKNIFKNSVLFCLIACMFLSMVACNVTFTPIETGTNDEAAETTTPEGDTSNDLLYKLEMQTVFEMAKEAGYTGTLEELIALFKGETGPAGINGITPHIGQNGNWWVGETDLGVSAQGFQGPKGDKGDKGDTGRGVLKMEMVNGELIVYYTDGTSQNLGPITNGDNDDSEKTELVYVVKVTDANNQPIEGVELVLCCGEARVSLSATLANGYTYSELIAQKDYTIRVVRADGYQFETDYDYTFVQNSNVAYIVIDGSGNTDGGNAKLCHFGSALEGSVTADANKSLDAFLFAHFNRLKSNFVVFEFGETAGVQTGAANGHSTVNHLSCHGNDIATDQACVALHNANNLNAHFGSAVYNSLYTSVHTGSIAARGQNANLLKCHTLSFLPVCTGTENS